MGIYSSGMSCWERRKAGLTQDHAGPETIAEENVEVSPEIVEVSPEIVEEVVAEVVEEVKEEDTDRTRERYYSKYFRSVTLPCPVMEDKVTATFDNGVLELRLPKAEKIKPRKIEIKAHLPEGETKKRQRKPRQKKS